MPAREIPPARDDGRHSDRRGTGREALLDAALLELRDHGYSATSLQAVARRAGLSKGAIYWSFRDKEDLFRALVAERVDAPVRELLEFLASAPGDAPTAGVISESIARLARDQRDIVLLLQEQWARAARDPREREAYVERQTTIRDVLARALEARHAATGVPLTYPAERLAGAILALATGLTQEALVDPEAAPDELLGEMLDLIYDGLAARSVR